MDQHRNALKPGFQLHWYHIREILGQGGFGITYLAQDTNLNQAVAIKEYLPVELAVREAAVSVHPVTAERDEEYHWGLERFINEAQTLARFRHPNIVRVLTVFKENNTAYMVMEYEQGRPMHEILKDRKTLPEAELKSVILPVLDGLEQVHAENFIHRDIKPANIYIREDQTPVLLDFGSARQSLGEHTRTLTTMISPGYAPFEQYVSKSRKQGTWTDIYGLGATLYRAATGIAPPDSMDRSEALLHTGKDIFVPATEIAADRYSAGFLAAIDHAMCFKPEDRPQTVAAWRAEIAAVAVPSLGAGSKEEDVTIPVITTGREDSKGPPPPTAPLKIDRTRERPPTDEKSSEPVPTDSQAVDRIYGFTKKALKWLLVLFVVLVIIFVLSRRNELDTLPEETTAPAVTPQAVPEESVQVTGNVAEVAPPVEVEDAPTEVEQLLAAARDDLNANRLTAPAGNNAVEKYRKVLELEPGNREAIQGLDTVVTRYLRLMDNALDTEKISPAQNYFDKATALNPYHPDIPAARSRLAAAQERLSPTAQPTEIGAEPVATAEPDSPVAAEPLGGETAPTEPESTTSLVPEDERARLHELQDHLRENPQDKTARRKLTALSKRFEDKIRSAMASGDYALAKDYIREVQSVSEPGSKSWRKLNELMLKVEEKEAQAGY